MRIRALTSVDDVVDAFGGTVKFGERYGCTKQQVSNYRATGKLPPRLYLRCKEDLKKIRCRAPCMLWGIDEPAQRIAS